MSPAVIPYKTTRFRCPTCPKTFANKSYAQGHADRCVHNPNHRTCKTCAYHFIYDGDPSVGERGDEGCEIDLGVIPAQPDDLFLATTEDSWDFQRECDGWEIKKDQSWLSKIERAS